MSNQEERDRLLQTDWREKVIPELGADSWIKVYAFSNSNFPEPYSIYCGLLPNDNVEDALTTNEWDLHVGRTGPARIESFGKGSEPNQLIYDRFGLGDHNTEPLVHLRTFHQLKPKSLEIAEEFRFFHNLFHERGSDSYVKIDDAGNDIEVVRTIGEAVQIRRKELREFLAIKNMSLALYFEKKYFSIHLLEDLGIEEIDDVVRLPDATYHYWVRDYQWASVREYSAWSGVCGKKIVHFMAPTNSDALPWSDDGEDEHELFIIGVDSNDKPIRCSPKGIRYEQEIEVVDSLGNSVKAWYLTPIFFERVVLNKYYSEPSKYNVEDGHVWCGGLWALRMDNNLDDYVIVFLGDLANELPVKEQSHWKHHNVPPQGGLSRTGYRRNILAEWAEAEDSALRFRVAYSRYFKMLAQEDGMGSLQATSRGRLTSLEHVAPPIN